MKPNSPELRSLLTTREFFAVDLWTVTLVDGTVFRHCAGDQDVTANGFLFPSGGQVGPYWDRTDNKAKVHWKVGTNVDSLVVDVIPGSATVQGAPFLQAVRNGVFDAAEVMLERAFMPSYGDTRRGTIRYFIGRVAEIDTGRSLATFSIKSHLELLDLQFPRNMAQPGCQNNLGDASCGVNLASGSYSTTGTISAGSTISVLNASIAGSSWPAGVFNLGTIVFTSGALNGARFSLKTVTYGTPSVIALLGFLPSVPATGDTFNLRFGCNKSYADANGCPKFANTAKFRGFPYVPQPSAAV